MRPIRWLFYLARRRFARLRARTSLENPTFRAWKRAFPALSGSRAQGMPVMGICLHVCRGRSGSWHWIPLSLTIRHHGFGDGEDMGGRGGEGSHGVGSRPGGMACAGGPTGLGKECASSQGGWRRVGR